MKHFALANLCFAFYLSGPLCDAQSDQGLVRVKIFSEDGSLSPARIKITGNGNSIRAAPAKSLSVMYGVWDHADGFAFQPDSSFYVDGYFELELSPGRYDIHVSKGLEYLDQEISMNVVASKTQDINVGMKRWINMNSRGWYSADNHIHVRRSPRENPILMQWAKAENLNVAVFLRMGDFWSTYYEQYGFGSEGVFQEGNFLLTSGQEDPRTPEVGHALGFGADDKVRFSQEYYLYDTVFDKIHKLNGVTGYAHQAESFHGYRGLILDGLRQKIDALELIQFCVSEQALLPEHYYHMLNLGFSITAIGGSDFPW